MHPATRSDRRTTIWPPHEVRTICQTYLDLVDEAAPGLVEGLYLHGSLGFGEWHAGRSDIDFVAVTSHRPGPDMVRVLRDVHVRLDRVFPQPAYDGFYVTWGDLAQPAPTCPDVPCRLGGMWEDEGRFDVNPVTWHELAGHGVTIRGPLTADVDIWTDTRLLRQYTHNNLESFWADQAAGLRQFPDEAKRPEIVSFFVLGASRLHHLLATDRLTSKDGGGRHAIESFGERWRPLVDEALSYRANGERAGVLSDEELTAQLLEFADRVVDDGLKIPL